MIDYRIADLWRQARTRAEATMRRTSPASNACLAIGGACRRRESVSDAAVRDQMRTLLTPFLPSGASRPFNERLAASGGMAAARPRRVSCWERRRRSTLTCGRAPACPGIGDVGAGGVVWKAAIADGTANPFGRTWALLIDQPDRAAALGGYRAATLMLLKRSLRNGQASVAHSLEYRAPEAV